MGVNPCCMPLKAGVKIITHLSMALAVAVCCMGVRLISISMDVSANPVQIVTGTHWNSYDEYQRAMMSMPMHDVISEDDSQETQTTKPGHRWDSKALLQFAHILLICGLLAVSATFFQFFSSLILLCCVEKAGNAPAQIWTAVNCGVLFCLSTCFVLFICQETPFVFSFDEKLFLCLVTADALLSIYFLWVVMAFI